MQVIPLRGVADRASGKPRPYFFAPILVHLDRSLVDSLESLLLVARKSLFRQVRSLPALKSAPPAACRSLR